MDFMGALTHTGSTTHDVSFHCRSALHCHLSGLWSAARVCPPQIQLASPEENCVRVPDPRGVRAGVFDVNQKCIDIKVLTTEFEQHAVMAGATVRCNAVTCVISRAREKARKDS